jgi:hypothetical protein
MNYRDLLADLAGAASLTVIGVILIIFLPLIGG